MHTTAEFVCNVIESQGVTSLEVEDLKTGELSDFREGSTRELCAHVDFLEANMGQPYRLRAYRDGTKGKPGKPTKETKPFVWTMLGTARGAAPVNGGQQPAREPAPRGPSVDSDLILRCAKAETEVEYLRRENERLQSEVDDLNAEADEVAAQPIQAAPPPPQPWWETTEGIDRAATIAERVGLTDLFKSVTGGMLKGKPAPKPQQPPPASAIPPTADLTDDERDLLQATRVWRADNPGEAEMAFQHIRAKYGEAAAHGSEQA